MDEERRRISLGMKRSYIDNNDNQQVPSDESDEDDDSSLNDSSTMCRDKQFQILDLECETDDHQVLEQVESRASIPPLEVTLDDMDQPDMNSAVTCQEQIDKTDTTDEKNQKRAKRKAKEERSFILSCLSLELYFYAGLSALIYCSCLHFFLVQGAGN